MSIASTFKEALKYNELKQEAIASEVKYSRQSITAWGNGKRSIPDDINPALCDTLDYPDYYLESSLHFTGGVGIPVLDGDYIDRNSPAAMKELVQFETNEALEKLDQVHMFKPVRMQTDQEREEMKKVIHELLDAACSIINMVAVLCREYDFSMKSIFTTWMRTLRARRMRS